MVTSITAIQDQAQKNNPLYGGTVNIGGNIGLSNKPITPELKAFNESMVKGINPNVINSQNLQDIKTVPLAPVPDKTSDYTSYINQVSSDLNNQVTQAQMQEQALREQAKNEYSGIAELQKTLSGKDEALTKEYETQGVRNLYNQLADLNVQAQGLQRESQAIPIQIQEEFKGRGATEAGVAPIQASRLRENALKALSLGQQSAVLSAQYDKAKNYADMLVEAKYKKIQGEIDAKLTNLSALKEFDLTPAQEKLRQAQERQLSAEKEQNDIKKTKEKAFNDIIIQASSQNAPVSLLDKAKATQDPTQAAMILGQYAGDYYKTELLKNQIATEKAQRAKYYTDIAKTRAEISSIGYTPKTIDGFISTLPKSSQERYYKLQNDFDQATKNYRGAIDAASSITALSKDSTPQQQTAIIFQYMKTLDPTSTVREGEFALVGKTAGLGDRAINALKKLDNGSRLNDSQIKDIVGSVNVLSENAKRNLDATSKEYDRRASKFGLPAGLFYEEQKIEPENIQAQNEFSKALGIPSNKIMGTQIINNVTDNGIDFKIPTK